MESMVELDEIDQIGSDQNAVMSFTEYKRHSQALRVESNHHSLHNSRLLLGASQQVGAGAASQFIGNAMQKSNLLVPSRTLNQSLVSRESKD